MGRHILEPDEIGRRVTDDRVDIGSGQELLGANEIGHPARPRARRAAPQAFDGPKARGSPRLDQHDQSQTPGRKGANLIRLHRAADEAARFWRHWKTSRFDPGTTGGAVPDPSTPGITAIETLAFDGHMLRISPPSGRDSVDAVQ